MAENGIVQRFEVVQERGISQFCEELLACELAKNFVVPVIPAKWRCLLMAVVSQCNVEVRILVCRRKFQGDQMLKLHVFSSETSVSKLKFVPLLCAQKKLEQFHFEVFLVFCVTADWIYGSLLFSKVPLILQLRSLIFFFLSLLKDKRYKIVKRLAFVRRKKIRVFYCFYFRYLRSKIEFVIESSILLKWVLQLIK